MTPFDWTTTLATALATHGEPAANQHKVGALLIRMQEHLEPLDYAYILHSCGISLEQAAHYTQLFYHSAREHRPRP